MYGTTEIQYQLPKYAPSESLLFGDIDDPLEKLVRDHEALTELFDETD